jgi:integrase
MPKKKAKHRGHKEGTICQRKDGRWCGAVLVGYNELGKPIRKYFYGKTREEVARVVAEKSNELFKGIIPIDADSRTTGEYVTDWVLRFKRVEVGARTFDWCLYIVNSYINPALGHVPLKKLSVYHIQTLLQDMAVKGIGQRLIQGVRDTLSQALTHAVTMKLLPATPMIGVVMPKQKRRVDDEKVRAIPIDARTEILAAMETDSAMKPILTTLMFTGIRTGEALALTWANVDFDARTLRIDRAVTVEPTFDEKGKRLDRKTIVAVPKTRASYRTIAMPEALVRVLQTWRETLTERNEQLTAPTAPVFCSLRTGTGYTYGGFRANFRRFLERAGLSESGITPHMFRHTFATMLLENDVNPRVVQGILGHADISTTLGVYSHVVAQVYENIAAAMNGVYAETRAGTYTPRTGRRI